MIIQRRSQCVCNSKKPHFCPPCFGEEGFYACDPEDIAANVLELQHKLVKEEQVNLDLDMQLSLTLKRRDELVVSLHNAEAMATKWGTDLDNLTTALADVREIETEMRERVHANTAGAVDPWVEPPVTVEDLLNWADTLRAVLAKLKYQE